MLATASQPEPSANAPCTRTTFLMPVGGAAAATLTVLSSSRVPPISMAARATNPQILFLILLLSSYSLNQSTKFRMRVFTPSLLYGTCSEEQPNKCNQPAIQDLNDL